MAPPEYEDPLDWVDHYWRKQKLGDPASFIAMGSMFRMHQFMTQEIERVLKPFELTRTSYLALATIQLSEHGVRLLSHIATYMLVHPTTITLIIDKLAAQGLVERVPHPTDRRATYAKITTAGTALMKKASAALEKADFGMPGVRGERASALTAMLTPVRRAAGDADPKHA
jgi:DNA-binding MarR family transcriptional regulator